MRFDCRGSMGPTDTVHIHGNHSTGLVQRREWRRARIRPSVCDCVDRCCHCDVELKATRRKYVSGNVFQSRYCWNYHLFLSLSLDLVRSFFQSVCVLGYCLAPVAGALVVCKILLLVEQTRIVFFMRLLATLCGFLWASFGKRTRRKSTNIQTKWLDIHIGGCVEAFTFCKWNFSSIAAAWIFLGDSQPANRKPLAVYPICFFYFILSWLVVSHSAI